MFVLGALTGAVGMTVVLVGIIAVAVGQRKEAQTSKLDEQHREIKALLLRKCEGIERIAIVLVQK